MGVPFYAVYDAAKASLARSGEALRRELSVEDVHVLTAYPGATDTPMMATSRAGPDLGFAKETAEAVAEAVAQGMEEHAFEVVRGGEVRAQMLVQNRDDPKAIDARFRTMKAALGEAVKDHSSSLPPMTLRAHDERPARVEKRPWLRGRQRFVAGGPNMDSRP